jgi:phosphate transport system permease protein
MNPPNTSSNPMHAPRPSIGALMGQAARGAFFTALAVSLAYVFVHLLLRILHGEGLVLRQMITHAGLWGGVSFVALFAVRLLCLSRSLADRAFTWTGFLATFFGLAMLLVFFGRLGSEVYQWLVHTPVLVEQQNRKLADDLRDIEKTIETRMAEIRKEMQEALAAAATEVEKKEIREIYETDVIPANLKDLRTTANEVRKAAELGTREDTSALSLLWHFLTHGPSRHPQDAGIWPALLGSLWLAVITILFAVPIGVGAALYLEEYRRSGWLAYVIQVNINNLAGVPSVVYGILGAFVFVEMIFKPLGNLNPEIAARNVLGGGLTLALLTLPVVIVSAQEAIRAVPSSIRHGAYALGATHWQVIWHQVLPLARPGILTGTILALSRAIGEAAPLVLFGALLYVDQDPSLFSRFTILPMQIFGWADRPAITMQGQAVEIWRYNAALASVILLIMLLALNAVAIYLRNRAQRRTRW